MDIVIRDLSIKNGVPFENLLAGIGREEFLYLIANSLLNRALWLCQPLDLGINSYKDKKNLSLNFADTIKGGSIGVFENFLGTENIRFRREKNRFFLEFYVEKMRVPLKVNLVPCENSRGIPTEETHVLLRSGEKFNFYIYPLECQIAGDLVKIFTELLLLEDMDVYFSCYEKITKDPLEGKLVWSTLEATFKGENSSFTPEALEVFHSYQNNTYLKNKWEKYKKGQKDLSDNWENVVNTIYSFAKPIWKCLCEDAPFIGDWMPKIGRFL